MRKDIPNLKINTIYQEINLIIIILNMKKLISIFLVKNTI